MQHKKIKLSAAVTALMLAASAGASAGVSTESLDDAMVNGKVSADIRVRFETVEQDNNAEDATALTERTRIGYTTGSVNGFSAMVEFEDVRIVGGVNEYTVGPTGFNPGQYSVIADPETTELDQGFLMYKSGGFSAKVGRQVMTFDNHRFIGHVGWRQDRQTFDGAAFNFGNDTMSLSYNYIGQRNRIFAEDDDRQSDDHLLNAAFNVGPGKLITYAYLLEEDRDFNNAIDTYGLRYAGSIEQLSFAAEYASQKIEIDAAEADADYMMAELAYNFGPLSVTGGYELMGSGELDLDGVAITDVGFATPLATLHKFDGWADVFLTTPGQGLEDISVSVSGKVGGGSWAVTYHEFSSDVDGLNYGSELDAVYSRNFGKYYNGGVKYADYSADDFAVDTTKIWVWVGAKF